MLEKIGFDGSSAISIPFSENNHTTTTIHVYRLNYIATIFTLCCLIAILGIIRCICRGRELRILKPPVPVLYYLAKTAYKPEHAQLCFSLIEKVDCDVNYPCSSHQLSLFLCACLSCNAELINFMLKRGADVTSVSCDGDSGFYLAVFGYLNSNAGDYKVFDLLISAGCDVNFRNNAGFNALQLASFRGNLPLVQYLLRNGADPSVSSLDSILPLDLALSAGNADVAEYLLHEMKYY